MLQNCTIYVEIYALLSSEVEGELALANAVSFEGDCGRNNMVASSSGPSHSSRFKKSNVSERWECG